MVRYIQKLILINGVIGIKEVLNFTTKSSLFFLNTMKEKILTSTN